MGGPLEQRGQVPHPHGSPLGIRDGMSFGWVLARGGCNQTSGIFPGAKAHTKSLLRGPKGPLFHRGHFDAA
jgi:hypothetical protein